MFRKYMRKRNVTRSRHSARYGVHHILAESWAARGRGSADAGRRGVSRHFNALGRHGYQLPVVPNAKEPPELMRAWSEGAWLGQFDEVAHGGYVSLAQFDDACANNVAY